VIIPGVKAEAKSNPVKHPRWLSDVKPAHHTAEARTVLLTIKKPGLFDHPPTAQDHGTMDGTDMVTPTCGIKINTTITALTTSIPIIITTLAVNHK
jgi:hypothetical protein